MLATVGNLETLFRHSCESLGKRHQEIFFILGTSKRCQRKDRIKSKAKWPLGDLNTTPDQLHKLRCTACLSLSHLTSVATAGERLLVSVQQQQHNCPAAPAPPAQWQHCSTPAQLPPQLGIDIRSHPWSGNNIANIWENPAPPPRTDFSAFHCLSSHWKRVTQFLKLEIRETKIPFRFAPNLHFFRRKFLSVFHPIEKGWRSFWNGWRLRQTINLETVKEIRETKITFRFAPKLHFFQRKSELYLYL